jgi:flagella basal body P-ring formation protein FlgA
MRFTLVPVSGAPVIAVASLRVVAEHVVARQAINRGDTITAETVASIRDEVRGVPLRRLPQAVQVVGGRALRPVPAGAVLLPGAVTVRRAIEPGDPVTVVARSGDIEVTASLVASDGGEPGDVIRVRNPETRRDLRGRVLSEGRVEVIYAR